MYSRKLQTQLALVAAQGKPSTYLGLEAELDRTKLAQAQVGGGPGAESYPMGNDVQAVSLSLLCEQLRAA